MKDEQAVFDNCLGHTKSFCLQKVLSVKNDELPEYVKGTALTGI